MEQSSTRPRYSVPRGGYSIPGQWKFNEYRVEGAIAVLTLCNRAGVKVGEAIIDAPHLDRVLRAAHWGLATTTRAGLAYCRGAARGEGVPAGRRKPMLFLHRFIMDAPAGSEVDHRDGNGLDCREANMWITDQTGNQRNSRQHRRERQLEDVIARLLRCTHDAPDCPCRRYAREVVAA